MKQVRFSFSMILAACIFCMSVFIVLKNTSAQRPIPKTISVKNPVEITIGDPLAPVIIVEYSSITCGHCASFAKQNFPKIAKEYIKKGHVFYIIREFPLDIVSLALAQVIFNQKAKTSKKLRETLLLNQDKWLLSKDPKKSALKILRLAGITKDIAIKSQANAKLKKKLLQQRLACSKMSVDATPTFFIYKNGESLQKAKQIDGFVEYAKFQKSIENFLKRHGQ